MRSKTKKIRLLALALCLSLSSSVYLNHKMDTSPELSSIEIMEGIEERGGILPDVEIFKLVHRVIDVFTTIRTI